MGFTDNVFDQKRVHRNSNGHTQAPGQLLPNVAQLTGKKRSLTSAEIMPTTPLRKFELPNPGTESIRALDMRGASREGSDYFPDAPFGSARSSSGLPCLLPSLNTFSERLSYSSTSHDDRTTLRALPASITTWADSAASRTGEHQDEIICTTLSPMLTRPPAITESFGGTALSITATESIAGYTHSQIQQEPQITKQNDFLLSKREIEPQTPASMVDAQITELEQRLNALRKYEQEFVSLELKNSQKLLRTEMQSIEHEIKNRKREKSLALIARLEKEGFQSIADGVKKEMATWSGG